eukprot:gene4942-6159_t
MFSKLILFLILIFSIGSGECLFSNKKPQAHLLNCDIVYTGDFYSNGAPINWWGFKSSETIRREVNLKEIDSKYLFSDTDEKGELCSVSWNKLFGSSRCGYLHPHHEDSDRFTWRRHPNCLIFNGSRVIGEVSNCPEANQIQIAAYSYDRGNKPYQNSSLLTMFETPIYVNQNYTMEIVFEPESAIYNLYTSISEGQTLIETVTIQHTYCKDWSQGYMLGWYFGGECPAPDPVSVCYTIIEQ